MHDVHVEAWVGEYFKLVVAFIYSKQVWKEQQNIETRATQLWRHKLKVITMRLTRSFCSDQNHLHCRCFFSACLFVVWPWRALQPTSLLALKMAALNLLKSRLHWRQPETICWCDGSCSMKHGEYNWHMWTLSFTHDCSSRADCPHTEECTWISLIPVKQTNQ